MTLVILAAGMGSRYGGLKQLDPMTKHGEFILDFSVFDAKKAGFDKVVFIIKKENEELFKETVGDRIGAQIEVKYAFQSVDMVPEGVVIPEGRTKPWGTAHALMCGRDAIGDDNMLVINADDFYGSEAFEAVGEFLKNTPKTDVSYCMAGYILRNTLTEYGSVSRGICEVDENNMLTLINERTKIYRKSDGSVVFLEGDTEYPTDENGYCSMNFWGLTPMVFGQLEKELADFFADPAGDPCKKECYLPVCINRIKDKGECTVKVLPTEAKWIGVTYPEDKPKVVEAVSQLIADGKYPDGLFVKPKKRCCRKK